MRDGNHTTEYVPTPADWQDYGYWELQRELGDCYANPLPTPEEEAELRAECSQPARDNSDLPF